MVKKQRRQYKNPPIVEALCEFRFADVDLDLDFPGRFHEKLKADYPEKPVLQQQAQQIVGMSQINVAALPPKIRFSSSPDNNRLVVVGPGFLSVHDLQPYSGWDKFKPRIETAFNTYQSLLKAPVVGLNLRYVNAINFATPPEDLREYFKFLPPKLKGVPQGLRACIENIQLDYPDKPYTAVIAVLSGQLAQTGAPSLVFDINIVLRETETGGLDGSKALDVVEDLRDRERDIFEEIITDKSRELFDA